MADEAQDAPKKARFELSLEHIKYMLFAGTLGAGAAGLYTSVAYPVDKQPETKISTEYNRQSNVQTGTQYRETFTGPAQAKISAPKNKGG